MLITQYDTDPVLMDLMNRHMGWHGDPMANSMGFPKRSIPMGNPGSGSEFLTFHGTFINDFFTWNNSHGVPISTSLLSPWITLPPEIKSQENATYQAADLRITTNLPAFTSADQMGIFIEGGIHNNFLHSAAASAYGEPILNTFNSPKSTYFYQLHGWINYWWHKWFPQKSILKDSIKEHKEHKEFIKEHKEIIKEHKEFIKEHKELFFEVQKHVPEIPKLKDAEGDPFKQHVIDPEILRGLHQRLQSLEKNTAKNGPFIKQSERPAVGSKIAKSAGKGRK